MLRIGGGRRPLGAVLAATVGASALLLVALLATLGHLDRFDALSVMLAIVAVFAGLLHEEEPGAIGVSAGFIVDALAAAFLGPASAGIAALLTELTAAARWRTRPALVLCVNLPASILPSVAEGLLIRGLVWPPHNAVEFYIVVGGAALAGLLLNFVLYVVLRRLTDGDPQGVGVDTLVAMLPSVALSVAVALAGVGIKMEIGNAGIAFALAAVLAFSYMVHLLRESRHRAEQYVALSWGVLGGLVRSLDIRDERTARHSAAVARFASDIAAAVGLGPEECELAHTAGLLHDIGRFALSDRVFERGRTLADEDWEAIQRHPELGADMLRDLGMYGPVAEIVLSHHERPDGLGFPRGLAAHQIPELAKIIAVAEVYDTLTASDTYRTQMSSFEALTELRRVAGTQLDAHYVEVLAGLLAGEGLGYRHADAADFDRELDMERRLREARAG